MTGDADTPTRPPGWQGRLWTWVPVAVVLVAFAAALVVGSRGLVERRWIALTLPVALLGEVLLTTVYARAF